MMMVNNLILAFVSLLVQQTTAQQCPPTGFDAVQVFDLKKFVGDRWYSVRQLPVSFQPEDQFNCVFAEYEIITKPSFLCGIFGCTDPPTISVFNSARDESPTGRAVSVDFRAIIPDATMDPAKANVGPKFIPNFLRRDTNYWVVAVGSYNELPGLGSEPDSPFYQYAIITTGAPETTSPTNNTKCYSDGGMWFFSREVPPPDGYVKAMEGIAASLGLESSVLKPVNQTGCDYENGKGTFFSSLLVLFEAFF
jgi:lipocalin